MPDLLGVTTGSRLIAMIVMHHHAGFRGQVLLSESMLSLVVVDKGDNIGEVLTGEIDLFAQSLFLGGYHRRRVTASQRNLILTLLLNVPKGRGFFHWDGDGEPGCKLFRTRQMSAVGRP